MKKDVIISIRGRQTPVDQDISKLEFVTEGKYYKKGNAYYVMYKESEVTGMDGTTTTLKIEEDEITLMRFGSVNSQFIFRKGQKHVSYYDTEYGAFTVGVTAHHLNVSVDDNGGEIEVDYEIEIDNNKTGYNDFCMFIREAGCSNDKYCG